MYITVEEVDDMRVCYNIRIYFSWQQWDFETTRHSIECYKLHNPKNQISSL